MEPRCLLGLGKGRVLWVLRTREGRERDSCLLSLCKFTSLPCCVVRTWLCFVPVLVAIWLPAGNWFPGRCGETEPLCLAVLGLLLC